MPHERIICGRDFATNAEQNRRSDSIPHDSDGRARLYADIAHPVNASCREMIQERVIEEFAKELDLAKHCPDMFHVMTMNTPAIGNLMTNSRSDDQQKRVDSAQSTSPKHEKPDNQSTAGGSAPPNQSDQPNHRFWLWPRDIRLKIKLDKF